MARRVRISAAEARRIALAAQGFDRARPDRDDVRHYRRVLKSLGLLQLDFVNVLVPAHYLVIWSRLGCYDRRRLHRFVYRSGEFTEQWAHEASIVPVGAWPLLRHRRTTWRPWKNNPINRLENRDRYLRRVLDQVRSEGAMTASDLPPITGPARKAGDWHRSVPRWALEFHFGRGNLAVADRKPNFQRVYDLPERVIPSEYLAQSIEDDQAQRALLRRAASALGVATLHDLADYFRMPPRQARARVAELVEAGELLPVEVENWTQPAFLAAGTRVPRLIDAASLLSPFDPVVWFRPRAERLFGFHYRIEIYVPEEKRQWGYYVLPFLLGDNLVARVDLKADRKASQLIVRRAHIEENVDRVHCSSALARELRALADWLGLESTRVEQQTRFEKALGRNACLRT